MHRARCEVALLKLLRQKMRRKTKTCYCVRFVTPSYDTSQLINVVETKRISKKKFYLFLLLLLKEKGYIFYNAKIEKQQRLWELLNSK